jgi:hypothetical protein
MAKKSYVPYVVGAGGLLALAAGYALTRKKEEPASEKPDEVKPPTPGPVVQPPTPQTTIMPQHGKLLVIGDQTAASLVGPLGDALKAYGTKHPDFMPTAVSAWTTNGATLASADQAIQEKGIPMFQDDKGTQYRPDVIVCTLSWADALSEDPIPKDAISRLSLAFANATGGHHPSVVWAVPPTNGKLPSYLGLQFAITTNAVGNIQALLKNTMFTPVSPTKDQLDGHEDTYFDAYGPTSLEAQDWAAQVADFLLGGALDTSKKA